MEPYYKRNYQVITWSTRQYHITQQIFSWKLKLINRPSSRWQEDSSNMYWNLSAKFVIELRTLLYSFVAKEGLNHFKLHKRRNFLVSYNN